MLLVLDLVGLLLWYCLGLRFCDWVCLPGFGWVWWVFGCFLGWVVWFGSGFCGFLGLVGFPVGDLGCGFCVLEFGFRCLICYVLISCGWMYLLLFWFILCGV